MLRHQRLQKKNAKSLPANAPFFPCMASFFSILNPPFFVKKMKMASYCLLRFCRDGVESWCCYLKLYSFLLTLTTIMSQDVYHVPVTHFWRKTFKTHIKTKWHFLHLLLFLSASIGTSDFEILWKIHFTIFLLLFLGSTDLGSFNREISRQRDLSLLFVPISLLLKIFFLSYFSEFVFFPTLFYTDLVFFLLFVWLGLSGWDDVCL